MSTTAHYLILFLPRQIQPTPSHPIYLIIILILYVSTTVFITQGNHVGYMFQLLISYLQAYSL